MISPIAYLLSIVAINWGFVHIPMIRLPWGDFWSVGTLGIGFVYVLRDLSQRRLGGKVIWLMAAGIAITALMSPTLAVASGAAFAIGEGIEMVIFTVSGRPFRQRVLWSALPAVVADTFVFLLLAGFFTWSNCLFEILTKMLALVWIRWLPRQ
jgi:uncharacterized PurR-regulated membrane protein YhhQ (DUF165 family)